MAGVFDKPFRFSWEALPLEMLSEWVSRRGVHGRHLTLAQFLMRKGYIVDRHSHPNEQITLVLRGALRLDFETGESYVLRDGEFIVVPPNLVHWGEVLEETIDFDAFSPPRSDWLIASGETYYTTGNRGGQTAMPVPESPVRSAPESLLCVHVWDELPTEQLSPGIERRSIEGQKQVFSCLTLEKGATYEGIGIWPERAIWVTRGSVRGMIEGEEPLTLRSGECLLVPENVPIRLEALEEAMCLEVMAGVPTCASC